MDTLEKKNIYTVYMHITPSNKKYIGITSLFPNKRWQNGFGYRGQVFFNAIEKYGWNNIQHIIIKQNLTLKEAAQLEIDLIQKYKTTNSNFGYNVTPGGDKSTLGYKHTIETKDKIAKKARERFSDKTNHPSYGIHRIGKDAPRYGAKLTQETKDKISKNHADMSGKNNPFYHKKHSEESKRKIAKAHLGKNFLTDETKIKMVNASKKKRCKPIYCITNNTVYAGASDAGRILNLNSTNITAVCKGKQHTSGGYLFEYYDINKHYINICTSEEYTNIFLNKFL